MIDFKCDCGQTLFFENTTCLGCGGRLGYDPQTRRMLCLSTPGDPGSQESSQDGSQKAPHCEAGPLCRNGVDFGVCNWIVREEGEEYCLSCRLNRTIPNLLNDDRLRWWKQLEHAKRRLIFGLLQLGLPVSGKHESEHGLAFRFIEDRRSNPNVAEEHVNTGHNQGMITINVAEADDVRREIARQNTGELYRTLLGHFRHESGHYYFRLLIDSEPRLQRFRDVFGDERQDYDAALSRYYAGPRIHDPDFISVYAQSHPLEDWAEIWAHYLHMTDTLETAGFYGMPQGSARSDGFGALLRKWSELTKLLNSLNRSMGLEDAYPFVLSEATLTKLRFVHETVAQDPVCPSSPPSSGAASGGTRS